MDFSFPGIVSQIEGFKALVRPLSEAHPASLKYGAWVDVRDLKIGDKGKLSYVGSPTMKLWAFMKDAVQT